MSNKPFSLVTLIVVVTFGPLFLLYTANEKAAAKGRNLPLPSPPQFPRS